jgi:hypothetical protein
LEREQPIVVALVGSEIRFYEYNGVQLGGLPLGAITSLHRAGATDYFQPPGSRVHRALSQDEADATDRLVSCFATGAWAG